MRARTVNFDRTGTPFKKLNIGSDRILQGKELVEAIFELLWPDVKYENYSREAGKPTENDLYEWIYDLIEENPSIQPDNIAVSDFADSWDMY